MNFHQVLEERASVRSYQDKPVEPEKLSRILKAVISAPSAGNLQAYDILVIEDAGRKRDLAAAALSQSFIAEAPVVLVISANHERSAAKYGQRGANLYAIQDATIAATYAHLAAVAEGLSSCWVGAFNTEEVSKVCATPGDRIPVAILPIGYAAEKAQKTSRRSLDEAVTFDRDL